MQINPAEFKLLVVDDVQTNVLLLKALLGKEGYGILVANNGQRLWKRFGIKIPT